MVGPGRPLSPTWQCGYTWLVTEPNVLCEVGGSAMSGAEIAAYPS